MSIEDQPTQQLRRPVEPPMPTPMNQTRPQAAARPAAPDDGGTEVLSLDNLFEGQNDATAPQAATPAASAVPVAAAQPTSPAEPPATPEERRIADRRVMDRRVSGGRIGVVPVAAANATAQRQPGVAHRLRHDTGTAVRGGVTRTHDWFTAGDNTLIVVTVLVALLLALTIGFAS